MGERGVVDWSFLRSHPMAESGETQIGAEEGELRSFWSALLDASGLRLFPVAKAKGTSLVNTFREANGAKAHVILIFITCRLSLFILSRTLVIRSNLNRRKFPIRECRCHNT